MKRWRTLKRFGGYNIIPRHIFFVAGYKKEFLESTDSENIRDIVTSENTLYFRAELEAWLSNVTALLSLPGT